MATTKNNYKINYINKMLPLPCAREPSLWIGIAAAATMYGAWEVISPDPKEVYHRVRGRSVVCDLKTTLADAPFIPPEANSAATRFLFRSLEWFDVVTWDVFLLDVFYEGLVKAAATGIKMHCAAENKGVGYFSGGPWFGGLIVDGTWASVSFIQYNADGSTTVRPSQITLQPGEEGGIAARATWTKAHTDTRGSVSMRIIIEETGQVLDTDSGDATTFDDPKTIGFLKHRNATDSPVTVAMQWSFSGTQSAAGTAMLLHEGHCSLWP